MLSLETNAIQAAIQCEWKRAIEINRQITKSNPSNINAYNRLAFAHIKLGNYIKASQVLKKVLKLDKYNLIAKKNLKLLVSKKKVVKYKNSNLKLQPNLFIWEPGKTKVVSLVKLAPTETLASLVATQPVDLIVKKYRIEIRDKNKRYLGTLPDDLTHHLVRLINLGNNYEGFVKNVSLNFLSIFIREVTRSEKVSNLPSFPSDGKLSTFYTSLPKKFIPKQELIIAYNDTDEESQEEESFDEEE